MPVSDVAIGKRGRGNGCRVGIDGDCQGEATVVGWSNEVQPGAVIGCGCTLYPNLAPARLDGEIGDDEVLK